MHSIHLYKSAMINIHAYGFLERSELFHLFNSVHNNDLKVWAYAEHPYERRHHIADKMKGRHPGDTEDS